MQNIRTSTEKNEIFLPDIFVQRKFHGIH